MNELMRPDRPPASDYTAEGRGDTSPLNGDNRRVTFHNTLSQFDEGE